MIGTDQSVKRTMTVAVAALMLVVALTWFQYRSRPQVNVVNPARGNAAQVVYATGNVEPQHWAKVVSLHRKRIVVTCDCEGMRVKKGDVLARLDDVEERAVLTELEARRDTIKADAERIAILLKRNVATQVAYDEKLTQLREYEARISARKDLLSDLDLRAPIDGVVLRSDATIGEIANIGNNDVLFWVGEPKPLEVEAEVNEEDIAAVEEGQKVLLRHDGFPNTVLTGKVSHITPKGDPDKKTFEITIALPDDTPLKIGMSVEANIIVKEAKNVLLVPAEALLDGHVQTVEDGRLKLAKVTIGIRGTTEIQVISGIEPATAIVTPASSALVAGTRVRIKSGPGK